ncbi:Uncharacterized protein BM_BM17121 [Brugia malayi]|uniref:Uncharacterized protein n=1 Tax=Brugia malayi TaxID=6279 RepID=A0A4E9G3A5_BRUMA|nr:Uncharacterized protein BM_BM17121 [Brugia malayi]VIO99974.1 Uncharacterized protein BM_BM17121 [Brugia malayi]
MLLQQISLQLQHFNKYTTRQGVLATIYRPRKYPRRIAYQALLPFVTSATHTAANIEKPKQLEVKMNERAIQQLHLTSIS